MIYTSSKAQQIVGISQPTLSKYSRNFKEYLSFNQPGHHRTYTEADIKNLFEIKGGYYSRKKYKDICAKLKKPEDPLDKFVDAPEKPLANSFDDLVVHIKLIGELKDELHQDMKDLVSKVGDIERHINWWVRDFDQLQERLRYEIAMHSSWNNYQKQIDQLTEQINSLKFNKQDKIRVLSIFRWLS